MNHKQTWLVLGNPRDIDSIHYPDILSAHYFAYYGFDNESIIEDEGKKTEFMKNATKYSFDRIGEIAFKVSEYREFVSIYVQPNKVGPLYLMAKKQKVDKEKLKI